ncbi:MAG: hypothetical protein ABF619_08595 [Oenococcus oeni]
MNDDGKANKVLDTMASINTRQVTNVMADLVREQKPKTELKSGSLTKYIINSN